MHRLRCSGIFDLCSETAELNMTKLDGKQDLNVLYQVCVFGLIRKPGWLPLPICQQMLHIVLRCTVCGSFGPLVKTTLFGEGSLTRVQYPKCAYDPYCLLNPI